MLDFEDAKTYAPLGRNKNTAIVRTFLEDLEAGGYYAMLYTYTSFAQNYLNMSELKAYDLWIADYRSSVGYPGSYGIWQYSSNGRVPGINGAVDLNIAYQNYASIIRRAGLQPAQSAGPRDAAAERTAAGGFWPEELPVFYRAGCLEGSRKPCKREVSDHRAQQCLFRWFRLGVAAA